MSNNIENSTSKNLEIGASQIEFLEKLSNANAVSGDEREVRQLILDAVKPLADEVKIDSMGNVLVKKFGKEPDRVKVMLASHMDEVGFMVVKKQND